MVLLALVVNLMKDGIKAGGTMLLPYLMAVPLMVSTAHPLPALPPAPAPFSAPVLAARARRCARHPAGHGRSQGLPAIIRRAGPEAEWRTVEFFETGIGNRNTRQAYAQAVMRFMNMVRGSEPRAYRHHRVHGHRLCGRNGPRVFSAEACGNISGAECGACSIISSPGRSCPVNPASPVRGPKDEAPKTRTKAAVLQPQEIRLLLDSVDVSDCSGLRDHALIAYDGFRLRARLGRRSRMDVEDSFARDGQD